MTFLWITETNRVVDAMRLGGLWVALTSGGGGDPQSNQRWRLVDRTNTNSREEIVCCLINTQQVKCL